LYISLTTNATGQARVYSPRYAVDTTALPPSSAAPPLPQSNSLWRRYTQRQRPGTPASAPCHCAPDAAGARRTAVLSLAFQPRCGDRLPIFKLFM